MLSVICILLVALGMWYPKDTLQSQLPPMHLHNTADYNHHLTDKEAHKLRRNHHPRCYSQPIANSGSNSHHYRHKTAFQQGFYQAECDEDVPLGTVVISGIRLDTLLRDLHSNPKLDVFVNNENFSAQWEGNMVNITTNGNLDADNVWHYQFKLTARVLSRNETATTTIRVLISNTNDEAPSFAQQNYLASVNETAAPNTFITTMIAADKDGDKVTYAFSDGTTRYKMFKIDRNTGVIRLHGLQNKINFEQNSYNFDVTATDDGSCCPFSIRPTHKSTTSVTIFITRANDHQLRFDKCEDYDARVEENKPIDTMFIQVTVSDADLCCNGQVTYSIVTAGTNQDNFKIDQITGEVKTNKIFDREDNSSKSISLTVKATANGEPPLEGLCTMQVEILDVNDNAPQFDRPQYSETIPRNKTVGDILFNVSASDLDAGQNAAVIYSIGPENSSDVQYFSINSHSGQVTLKKELAKTNYSLHVTATDSGIPPLKVTVPVVIELAVGDALLPQLDNNRTQPIKIPNNTTSNTVNVTSRTICLPGSTLSEKPFQRLCLNGGICVYSIASYKCICPEGFAGFWCEVLSEKTTQATNVGYYLKVVLPIVTILIFFSGLYIYFCKRRGGVNYCPEHHYNHTNSSTIKILTYKHVECGESNEDADKDSLQ